MVEVDSGNFSDIINKINKIFKTPEAREKAKFEFDKTLSSTSDEKVQNSIIRGVEEIFVNAKDAAKEAQELLKSKGLKISKDNMLNNLNCANDVCLDSKDLAV